jgi:hypothetical protein
MIGQKRVWHWGVPDVKAEMEGLTVCVCVCVCMCVCVCVCACVCVSGVSWM